MEVINYKENPNQKLPDDFTGKVIFGGGSIEYLKNGKLHREDDLPTIEWSNGDKEYYVDGKRHRINGPAVIGIHGFKEYWINGKEVTKEAHGLLYNLMKLKGILK